MTTPAPRPTTGFAVLYRFRVDPDQEHEFVAAWSRMTEFFRDHRDSHGSRLHRGDDGLFYAYAQWPDREHWQSDAPLPTEVETQLDIMKAATLERFPATELTPIADYLLH